MDTVFGASAGTDMILGASAGTQADGVGDGATLEDEKCRQQYYSVVEYLTNA